jgi:hypothetical protein
MSVFDKVTFYCRKEDANGVRHMFPVDSEAKSHDTAKSWANEGRRRWDSEKREYVYEGLNESKVFEYENKGFDHVTIIDLYHRGNGGRAYQIILEVDGNKFRMDLREDTLLEVIEQTGIQAGGRLNGTFCFAKEVSQTNLILEGTKRHKELVEYASKKKEFSKPLKRSELKVGHKYSTVSGDTEIFLGFVYTAEVKNPDRYSSTVAGIQVGDKPYKAMLFCRNNEEILDYLRTGEIKYKVEQKEDRDTKEKWEERTVDTHFYCETTKNQKFAIEGEKILEGTTEEFVARLKKLGTEHLLLNCQAVRPNVYSWSYETPLEMMSLALDRKEWSFNYEALKMAKAAADREYDRRRGAERQKEKERIERLRNGSNGYDWWGFRR